LKIAYRRMSGAIGVTTKEQGTRGLWWEKRRALVDFLTQRGHEVSYFNRMTKQSASFARPLTPPISHYDILIVEFGSSNKQFYGKDLDATIGICNSFRGPKIFINDDPDLPFIWDAIRPNDWVCWHNALKPVPLGKQYNNIPIFDMPFSSLMDAQEPAKAFDKSALVYIGRPLGRGPIVRYLIANKAPWKVYGKQAEWDEFGIFVSTAPDQPKRAEFYAGQLGSLVLADKKHKEMGWRTGRAFHAVMAGCPSIIEADHTQLGHLFKTFKSIDDINKAFHRWRDPELRLADWSKQAWSVLEERDIAVKTLEKSGL
jgi:uncharacterized protein YceK